MELIKEINGAVNSFVWGIPAMVCIIGVGIYLSLRTGFIQFRKFGYTMRVTSGLLFQKSDATKGSVTPLQDVFT
ncbi:MAG: sodium:alanine symporter family protein, partial [Lachnospiraceae bacterium]